MKILHSFFLFIALITTYASSSQVTTDAPTSTKGHKNKVNSYIELAQKSENVNLSSAMDWLDQSENYCVLNNYPEGLFLSLKEKGMIYYSHGLPDSSLVQCNHILQNQLAVSNKDRADIYNLIGISHQSNNDLDSAFTYLNLAHELYTTNNLQNGLIGVLANLGNCFYESGDPKQALKFHESAFHLALAQEDQEKILITLSNYSMFVLLVESDHNKVDSLIHHFFTYEDTSNSPVLISTLYQNLGTFSLDINDLERAEDYFKKALYTTEGSTYHVHSGIYTGLGMVNSKENKYREAITYYKLALNNSVQNSELRLIYEEMASAFSVSGNIDSAAVYWEKKIELIEEIENQRNNDLMLQSASNLEVLKKEHEIAILQKESKVSKLSNRIKLQTIIGLGILVILGILISYFLYKRKKNQLQLKETEINSVNQKLMGLSLKITQKNQILIDFREYLKSDDQKEDLDTFLTRVQNKLQTSLQIDKDWENFELYFNDLHDGFYQKLKSEFPELSNSELRICSLSKLRLNIKEIANILNLSGDSIKSSRYRIRKKLNLQTNKDLSDFLNEI